jgi:hypothetical protein
MVGATASSSQKLGEAKPPWSSSVRMFILGFTLSEAIFDSTWILQTSKIVIMFEFQDNISQFGKTERNTRSPPPPLTPHSYTFDSRLNCHLAVHIAPSAGGAPICSIPSLDLPLLSHSFSSSCFLILHQFDGAMCDVSKDSPRSECEALTSAMTA